MFVQGFAQSVFSYRLFLSAYVADDTTFLLFLYNFYIPVGYLLRKVMTVDLCAVIPRKRNVHIGCTAATLAVRSPRLLSVCSMYIDFIHCRLQKCVLHHMVIAIAER